MLCTSFLTSGIALVCLQKARWDIFNDELAVVYLCKIQHLATAAELGWDGRMDNLWTRQCSVEAMFPCTEADVYLLRIDR